MKHLFATIACLCALAVAAIAAPQNPVLMDMVHNNPGEAPFDTHYNDPKLLKSLGYKAKTFELFESAQFGIDWSAVDPDVFPEGTPDRKWVDAKGAELDKLYNATKAAGLDVYCHTDMIVLPKRLVEKYKIQKTFGDLSDPQTQKFVRLAVAQMFERFPQLDGLVVRIGETYLQGAPYHTGSVLNKDDPQKTIIPLMNLLRDEVCVKRGKRLFFRSWLSFDTSVEKYTQVSDGVEPHPNLYIVVKHCEGDFRRGNPFSKVLGIGRHKQLVEVQCQREYEGKGAYPNYIANGVIEGFEEHTDQSVRRIWSNSLTAGMSTWSRGGGWAGPYITNELWCDVNVYVLSHWVEHPEKSEADVLRDYCTEVLGLNATDAKRFRRLCLLSAEAIYRGMRSTHNDISPWWTRDQNINRPELPGPGEARQRVLDEKDESVAMWNEIVDLAKTIKFRDPATQEYAVTSSQYGLLLYRIYRAEFRLMSVDATTDKVALKAMLDDYEQNWAAYRQLKADHPSSATLYSDNDKLGIAPKLEELRKRL
ncbi:hypothetical protein IAD21_04448 [Abditibacteriota bacterium]|nr:hypothetical protein IAD21_04448 [Abditibacteriota bacterium]